VTVNSRLIATPLDCNKVIEALKAWHRRLDARAAEKARTEITPSAKVKKAIGQLLERIGKTRDPREEARTVIVIDPREELLQMVRRVAKLPFPSRTREREATAILLNWKARFSDFIKHKQYSELVRAIADVERQINALTKPARVSSLREQANKLHAVFEAKSWTSEEIDALGNNFGPDGEISEIAISSVKVGERQITRTEIRARLRGLCSNARLASIERQEDQATKFEAENRARKERGETAHHRTW
jgi:hypothetical protein